MKKQIGIIGILILLVSFSLIHLAQVQEERDHAEEIVKEEIGVNTIAQDIELQPVAPIPEAAEVQQRTVLADEEEVLLEETVNSQIVRLNELEQSILNQRQKQDSEDANNQVHVLEGELKLWQGEIDRMVAELETIIVAEDYTRLLQEQQDWSKRREENAIIASDGISNATEAGIKYIASLVDDTKQRAYDLALVYGDLLLEN